MRATPESVSLFTVLVLLAAIAGCSSAEPVLMDLPPPSPEMMMVDQPAGGMPFNVLVFSKTPGFRHTSIEAGIAAVKKLGQLHGFGVDATEDSTWFEDERLGAYDAVIFLNTDGVDLLSADQKAAFERYIRRGGGFVGVHAAAATEYEWPWYGELVGAYFANHPQPQTAEVQVLDRLHPSTAHLPARWERFDEWYNYRSNPRSKVHVLAVLNEHSYEGGRMNHDHPIAWAHEFDGGRAWYTGLGHTEESYSEDYFLQHLLGGIEWAIGRAEGNVDATLAGSYSKEVLMNPVTDPMEIDVADDGRVFLVERAGAVKMWDPKTKQTKDVGWIPVYMVIEDGLLGVALDPEFVDNGWMYVFYAPENAGPSRLSRFTIAGDRLDPESEKILLEVPVQREVCCHAGGSLAFDRAGNLYLSTGDNSNPLDTRGGSPMDERPGKKYGDAQRTSGNTNDLRGKILRIHPEPDGTYTIPEGNLFQGDALHHPEIYTMGHRNPFRISLDSETGWLYWGDVGQGNPPNKRGGAGWDEFNQARGPGFFGWPYFAGKNDRYNAYDYETDEAGAPFDPAAPVNDSPNNTGARELPPAQPAMIAYTYGTSEEFPGLGAGGINPMAGPVYHKQPSYGPTALPAYYEDTHIIYEWMRNWVQLIKFDEQGDILNISPFLPGMEFIRPMDMEIGPEGALYVIEWGDDFWGSNENAQVVRISYHPDLASEVTPQPTSVHPTLVRFDRPRTGSFFDFDDPIDYSVIVTDEMGRQLSDYPVTVSTYSGFDTHRILLETSDERAGKATVTRAYTHTPDLHYVDRFAEIEACVSSKTGFEYCNSVKLHPRKKEAEHVAWHLDTTRQTHGTHPASKPFPRTALTTMQVQAGSALAYEPINLDGVLAVTLRFKRYENAQIVLRADKADGRVLGRVALDDATVIEIPRTPQAEFIDEVSHDDEFGDFRGLDRSVFENWSEVTVPISVTGEVNGLVLTFEGEAGKMLLELDWMRFD